MKPISVDFIELILTASETLVMGAFSLLKETSMHHYYFENEMRGNSTGYVRLKHSASKMTNTNK